MLSRGSRRSHLCCSLAVILLLISFFFCHRASAAVTASGYFSQRWGDSFQAELPPRERYFLSSDTGETRELLFSSSLEAQGAMLRSFNGRRVIVTAEQTASRQGGDSVPPLLVTAIGLSHEADDVREEASVSGNQPWVSVMCKFADIASEPRSRAYFSQMYSSSYPGLDHYWRESSYNRVNISGSSAHGWYTLPNQRSHYISGGRLNFDEITSDCIARADSDIYFPSYVGINLMFNAELDGYAWGGTKFIVADNLGKTYRMTWEPPWGYADITVIAHEMGHGFGMPHSSGDYGQVYDNVWDVMSNAWANCGASFHPTYGCLGQHTIGYHRLLVGWLPADRIYTHSGPPRTITLERITQPLSSAYLLAKIPIGGASGHYYTVEVRQRQGYDVKLAAEAVLIHEIDTSRQRPAHIVDIDNNGNTGDGGARWAVGETFEDRANDVCIEVIARSGSTYTLRLGCESSSSSSKATMPPIMHLLLR